MKKSLKILSSLIIISSFFLSCRPEFQENYVEPVNFSISSGSSITPGTELTLKTASSNYIYYSINKNFTQFDYKQEAEETDASTVTFPVIKSGTITAIAIDPEGNTSEITTFTANLSGPNAVEMTPNLFEPGTPTNIYVGSKIPQKVYDEKFLGPNFTSPTPTTVTLQAPSGTTMHYFTTVNNKEMQESDVYLESATGTEILDMEAIMHAALDNNDIVGINQKITLHTYCETPSGSKSYESHTTFTFVPIYVPLVINDGDADLSLNYDIESNINEAINQIGDNQNGITIYDNSKESPEEGLRIEGIVVAVDPELKKNANNPEFYNSNYIIIQDKYNAIEYFKNSNFTNQFYPGMYISFIATKGKVYTTFPEITESKKLKEADEQQIDPNCKLLNELFVCNPNKDSAVIYYRNYNCISDMSGLTTLELCGIKTNENGESVNRCANIKSSKKIVGYKSLFGVVKTAKNNTIDFETLYIKNKNIISDNNVEYSFQKTVSPVFQKVSAITKDSPYLIMDCVTPDVTVKYTIETSTETSAETVLTGSFNSKDGFPKINLYDTAKDGINIYHVTAKASKPNYLDSTSEMKLIVAKSDDIDVFIFKDWKNSIVPEQQAVNKQFRNSILQNSKTRITLDAFGPLASGNIPFYSEEFENVTFNQSNNIIINSDRLIKNIYFIWGVTPPKTDYIVSTGEFSKENAIWTGQTHDISFIYTSSKYYCLGYLVEYEPEDYPEVIIKVNGIIDSCKPKNFQYEYLKKKDDEPITLELSSNCEGDIYYSFTDEILTETDVLTNEKFMHYDGTPIELTSDTHFSAAILKDGKIISPIAKTYLINSTLDSISNFNPLLDDYKTTRLEEIKTKSEGETEPEIEYETVLENEIIISLASFFEDTPVLFFGSENSILKHNFSKTENNKLWIAESNKFILEKHIKNDGSTYFMFKKKIGNIDMYLDENTKLVESSSSNTPNCKWDIIESENRYFYIKSLTNTKKPYFQFTSTNTANKTIANNAYSFKMNSQKKHEQYWFKFYKINE